MKALLDGGADPFLTLPDRTTTLMIAAGQGYGGIRGEGIRIVVPTPEGAVEALTSCCSIAAWTWTRSTTPATPRCTARSAAATPS